MKAIFVWTILIVFIASIQAHSFRSIQNQDLASKIQAIKELMETIINF